jgi:two-component system, LytTR family, response regulator
VPRQLRVLVVDDEPLAREGVRLLLARLPDVTVVGEAGDGREAVAAVRRLRPDLVLLDVQMPGPDGFAVVEALASEPLPLVIFVTAHDVHAVRAFDVHALDYVLKPIVPARLADAVDRARAEIARGAAGRGMEAATDRAGADGGPAAAPYATRFAVRDRDRFLLVRAADLDWVESAANYVRLSARGRDYLLRGTMAEMERRLDPAVFTRIHRSTIVNTSRIREIRPDPHGDFDVVLIDGRTLRMSRNYRHGLLAGERP